MYEYYFYILQNTVIYKFACVLCIISPTYPDKKTKFGIHKSIALLYKKKHTCPRSLP